MNSPHYKDMYIHVKSVALRHVLEQNNIYQALAILWDVTPEVHRALSLIWLTDLRLQHERQLECP